VKRTESAMSASAAQRTGLAKLRDVERRDGVPGVAVAIAAPPDMSRWD
jgi:hypothetical protein